MLIAYTMLIAIAETCQLWAVKHEVEAMEPVNRKIEDGFTSALCSIPPPQPAAPCGGDGSEGVVDGVKILPGGKCSSTGWCSGRGFSGAARMSQVLVQ